MKNLFVIVTFLFFAGNVSAQDKEDGVLNTRLNEYMKLSQDMNIDKLLDYMHPNIFKIVPRDELSETMKSFYSNEDIGISIDSIGISGIGPVFVSNKTNYRDVRYKMVMSMWLKTKEVAESDESKAVIYKSLKAAFPDKSVVIDAKTNKFVIRGESLVIAIQDPGEQWMFLGYEKSQAAMVNLVFPKDVIEHYKL